MLNKILFHILFKTSVQAASYSCSKQVVKVTRYQTAAPALNKVDVYDFRGSNSTILIFFPSQWIATLKGKNLLPKEQILSFNS